MKKILLIVLISFLFLNTGCIKRDSMEDITIYTTIYPIQYITEYLYGEYSNVYSIYPTGAIVDDYILTDKQIQDYSKAGLFVFNGYGYEKNYVEPMFHFNKKLAIINTSDSMNYKYGIEELWLDPLNMLKMARNVKSGLNKYINNGYLKNNINTKFNDLEQSLSSLDAKMQLTIENKNNNKKLVVSSKLFQFLKKYDANLEIYCLDMETNDPAYEAMMYEVKRLIKEGEIEYIFMRSNEEENVTIKSLLEETEIKKVTFHTLFNLTESEKNSNEDYFSLMLKNIELLRQELAE